MPRQPNTLENPVPLIGVTIVTLIRKHFFSSITPLRLLGFATPRRIAQGTAYSCYNCNSYRNAEIRVNWDEEGPKRDIFSDELSLLSLKVG